MQPRTFLDQRLLGLVDRHVRRVGHRRPRLGRIVCPVHGVAQDRADIGVVVDRIGLVARAEIEDAAGAALVGEAGTEHLAALEPGDEHRLQRLRHGERFAIHFRVGDLDALAEPLGDAMAAVDHPDALALAGLAPFQRARRAHQLPEDFREMRRSAARSAPCLPRPASARARQWRPRPCRARRGPTTASTSVLASRASVSPCSGCSSVAVVALIALVLVERGGDGRMHAVGIDGAHHLHWSARGRSLPRPRPVSPFFIPPKALWIRRTLVRRSAK